MSPERLWRLSAALRRRGLVRLALLVKKLNSVVYHNSLAPGAKFSPDIRFEHHGFGTVIHSNVEIGRNVRIFHNVTIAVRAQTDSLHRIVIELSRVPRAFRGRREMRPHTAEREASLEVDSHSRLLACGHCVCSSAHYRAMMANKHGSSLPALLARSSRRVCVRQA